MLEGWWAALVAVVVLATGVSGDMARLRQREGPGLTSSTLQWVDAEAGKPLPPGALQADKSVGAWCRFAHHGHVAGVVRDGVCHAPFMDTVVTSDKYEALVSINDSARMLDMEWLRSAALSPGGVQVSKKRLLALARTPEGAVLPGFVDVDSRRAYMLNGNEVERYEEGVILTEDEPKEYRVDKVVWGERAVLHTEDHVLLNFTLSNSEAEAQQVSEEAQYTATDGLYWGNVRGTVKGVPAMVTGPGGQVWNVTWGVRRDLARVAQQMVSLEVPAGAAVDVKLVGVIHKYEAPYTAQVTAVYKDGAQRTRPVASLHQHEYLGELRAEFSRPRSLADGQELEGDFPTSEVLITSTTTTSTTTTTPAPALPGTDVSTEKAGSVATPKPNAAPAALLPSPLLATFLALLVRLGRP